VNLVGHRRFFRNPRRIAGAAFGLEETDMETSKRWQIQ